MEIIFKNVYKSFKNNVVLNNVNIKFESNKIYGFVGPNGAGKSVLLKLLCGFYKTTSGSILIDGSNLEPLNAYKYNMRALIEKPSFFPNLSGFENLKLLAKICNKIGDKEINDILKVVNLYEEKDKKFNSYSLGMKQKLGIAQALMENPNILILDEAFNGLDNTSVKKIKEFILSIKKNKMRNTGKKHINILK